MYIAMQMLFKSKNGKQKIERVTSQTPKFEAAFAVHSTGTIVSNFLIQQSRLKEDNDYLINFRQPSHSNN